MTKEQLAALLHGRQYRHEITPQEEANAKAAGLVVVFGASDDLMEFRGVINDELGAYGGTTACVTAGGLAKSFSDLLENDARESEFEAYFAAKAAGFKEVHARWDKDGFSWVIETDIPHAVFSVMEDDEAYCRGVVFSLAELESTPQASLLTEDPDHGSD